MYSKTKNCAEKQWCYIDYPYNQCQDNVYSDSGREWSFQVHTVCPRSLDPIYKVTWHIKWVKTSLTYSVFYRMLKLDLKLSVCIQNIQNIQVYKTVSERFVDVFKEHVLEVG